MCTKIRISLRISPPSHCRFRVSFFCSLLQYDSNTIPILLQYYSNTTPILLHYYSNTTPLLLQYYSTTTPLPLHSHPHHPSDVFFFVLTVL
ncbi:MAG: hypothetical protein K6D57_07545 [Paludibacteraceae bacterium]|nr:hypothetical protein [Paludibacteraceae bacterium]